VTATILAAVLIAAVLLLPAVGGPAAPPPSLPGLPHPKVVLGDPGRFGGVFLDAQVSDPRTFNPILAQETSSTGPIGGLFDGLIEDNGETTETEPALAESWTTSKDGRTWTFVLRQGLQWSDGVPMTADDIVFTFQVIYDKQIPNSLQDVLTVAGQPIQVAKVDDRTVRLRTAEPFGPFLRSIGVGILPRHKLEAAYKAGKFNQTWGVNTPTRELVGTGTYIMTEYKPAQRIAYVRNPYYWKADLAGHRLPYIDRLVLTIVPDQNAHRLLFQQGQDDSYGIRPREYAEFKRGEQAGHYTVYDGGPSFGTEFLTFNQNPRSGLPEYKLKWFRNQKFRQGVAYAIDRQSIADQVYAGHAVPQYGPESPADKFFFNPKVMQYPYNLDKAAATLAEAGFKKGADGVLRDADGHPVQFIISTNADNQDRVAIGNIIRSPPKRSTRWSTSSSNPTSGRPSSSASRAGSSRTTARTSGSHRGASTCGIPRSRARRPSGRPRSTGTSTWAPPPSTRTGARRTTTSSRRSSRSRPRSSTRPSRTPTWRCATNSGTSSTRRSAARSGTSR
jgi:peptide/nickel transport system substrate-binding protein